MKRSATLLSAALLLASAATAPAAEQYVEFVEGLRNRGYYDVALQYLDSLETRPNVPEEIRQVVPFEKATTLQRSAASLRNLDLKTEQLSQAEAFLEQFVKASPLHPRAGQANSERANILLGRATVATWQSRSPSNASKKAEFQAEARALVQKARTIFKAAHDQHMARWKSYPNYINESENPQQYRERRAAEIDYIRAQLDLALCTYHEAQTYDPKAPEFSKLLTQASLEFEEVHSKYRSLVAGLYARMWQGKCFEEQDEIRKALGVYNELLDHGKSQPGQPPVKVSSTMKQLQDKVLHFRLICLNHEQRQDYKVVIDEATEWLGRRPPRSEIALAIIWERARAREALAAKLKVQLEELRNDRTLPSDEKSKATAQLNKERNDVLDAGIADLRYINRWPGEYKDVSTFMLQRLLAERGKEAQDPKDFDTAFGLARSKVKGIKEFNDQIADPNNKGKLKELRAAREAHLAETIRILKLSLDLAEQEQIDLKQVNHARYMLAYLYYLTRQSYEAAVLGEFVGLHFDKESAQMGLDSAYLAMAAFVQAHNEVPKGESKDFEMRQMARMANMITSKWPESDRANEARMTLGRIYGQLKKPVEGAEWYSKVPTSAPQYTQAQIAAGQSFWTAYLEAAPLPDTDPAKPKVEELQKWQDAAQQHLETGIAKAATQLPENATGNEEIFDEYIAAKVSLSQIRINKGEYQSAIDLLLNDPHSPMKAIVVPDGTKRPATGPKSAPFAGLCYQLLLRAYVGTQKIDLALKAMEDLEKLTPDAEGVMQIYVQLGRELEKEIERLQKLGLTDRLAEVRTSFEKFLGELYNRKDSMTAGSLIWIAETYYGLAKGLDDKAAATAYFNKAADTYQNIIDSSQAKGAAWLDPARVTLVKLRLVTCRRRQGEFETALAIITEVLAEKPKVLDAQFEGAYVLQDWADSGQGDNHKRFLDAINGKELGPKKAKLWGWGGAAQLLQRRYDAGVATPEQKLQMYEARHNSIWCRHRYALTQSSTPKKEEALASARQELETFVAISANVPEEWQEKFNAVYGAVLQSMVDAGMKDANGQPVVVTDIEWPAAETARPKPVEQPQAAVAKKPQKEEASTRAAEPAGMNWKVFTVMLVVAFGGAYAVYYFMSKQGTPRPVTVYGEMAPILPPQGEPAAPRKRAAGKPQPTRTAAGTAQRPRTKPPAGTPPAPPRKPRQEQP